MIARVIIAAVHPGWALTLSLAVTPQPGPPSQPASDLLSELATKVAAIVGTASPAPKISIHCSSNLRERVCTAEIGSGAARDVVLVTRPHDRPPLDSAPAIPVVVQLRPIVAQAEQILDAAIVGRTLLVLDAGALTLFDSSADGWRRGASFPLPASEPWPRDLRGRLVVSGGTWEAFLPGMVCRGPLDPLRGTCTRGQQPWPLGIENSGLTPSRNTFSTAGGHNYFSAAPLEEDAGARWMLAADGGTAAFLDSAGTRLDAPPIAIADVAAIATPCADGSHAVVVGRAIDAGRDSVRVVRIFDRQLEDVAAPVALAGRVTALWTTLAGDGALVVARNPTTRGYEAFHAVVSCGR
jgi:hypothetical protein